MPALLVQEGLPKQFPKSVANPIKNAIITNPTIKDRINSLIAPDNINLVSLLNKASICLI